MRIRFWGTRGSLPKPGPTTLRYGGNTSCVEVRTDDGTLIVFDCGTGSHDLGQALLASGEQPIRGHLLISHTHWDHIQGFPFFPPLFVPGNEWDIYAPGGLGQELATTLAGQMQYTYFPVALDQLGATIRYHDLVEGTFEIGPARVTTQYLNHPALALGYRLEVGGVDARLRHRSRAARGLPGLERGTDGVLPGPRRGSPPCRVPGRRGSRDPRFPVHGPRVPGQEGLGPHHRRVVRRLRAGGRVKRLVLFHHDPLRDDDSLDRVLAMAAQRAGAALEVIAAAEGQVIELPERGRATRQSTESGRRPCCRPRPIASTVAAHRADRRRRPRDPAAAPDHPPQRGAAPADRQQRRDGAPDRAARSGRT